MTYDSRHHQAHPSSDEAFTTYLRRRAMENLAEYERSTRPWWHRVNWLNAAAWTAIAAGSALMWFFAGIGFVTVIS